MLVVILRRGYGKGVIYLHMSNKILTTTEQLSLISSFIILGKKGKLSFEKYATFAENLVRMG